MTEDLFSMGKTVAYLKQELTEACAREMLKMSAHMGSQTAPKGAVILPVVSVLKAQTGSKSHFYMFGREASLL